MQHVALRLQSQPYLDRYIWEKILRKTDWETCLSLNHISIARELLPTDEEAQKLLNNAVAKGDMRLVSRMLQTFVGFLDMDIAAKADQFWMLKVFDKYDKSGTQICKGTGMMAVHAAENSNQEMLQWLIKNRMEVDGKGIFKAAARTGSMHLIHWILKQADKFNIACIDSSQTHDALCMAFKAGHADVACFLIEQFSLHSQACYSACECASLTLIQQILPGCSESLDDDNWYGIIAVLLRRNDMRIFSAVLEFMHSIGASCFLAPSLHSLLEVAAAHSDLRMVILLYANTPDDMKESSITDEALDAAAGRGILELVTFPSMPTPLYPLPTQMKCHAARA